MGWKIPEIKIRVPEVRAPRAPRTMAKPARLPRAPRRTATSGRLLNFDLTIFSGGKNTTHIDVIRELLAAGGSRSKAAGKLGISQGVVSHHAKNIRRMTDAQLQAYANQLGITVEQIRTACADITPQKGIKNIDIIRELIASGGSRTDAAAKLGVSSTNVINRLRKIRRLPDAQLQVYADRLGINIDKIKNVCADIGAQKGITHIDVLRKLFISGGNRTKAAEMLGITTAGVSRFAKTIRLMTDNQLQGYANQLGVAVEQIKKVCADISPRKGITAVDVLRELLACGGDRVRTAKKLRIAPTNVSKYTKNIRNSPDAKLQEYADQLNTSVEKIKNLCADTRLQKGITSVDIIRELLDSGGNRVKAAKKLKIGSNAVSEHAKNIRQLSDAQLKPYAEELSTTVARIREVCANLDSIKGITHIDVIKALIASDGNRKMAAEELEITSSCVRHHAKNIEQLPVPELQKHASQLSKEFGRKITVHDILDVVSPRWEGKIDVELRKQIIRALIACDGNRTNTANILKVTPENISHHAKNLRQLSDAQLKPYADSLGVNVKRIREVCANLDSTKGITHIDVINALLAFGGNRIEAAGKLGIIPAMISLHAKNIRRLPDAKLQEYAKQLNITVEQIKNICADISPQKGITAIDTIRELLASGGDRTKTAKKLKISKEGVSHHAKNIRQLSDAQLKPYADSLGVTVERIRKVCADMTSTKGITHIDIIRALLASGANRTKAAEDLRVNTGTISDHIKNIRQLPDAKLREYADQLGTTVERVKAACAPLKQAKGKLFVK